jgi:predicted AlkP superfamily phosphohydrolase/phosphomutase
MRRDDRASPAAPGSPSPRADVLVLLNFDAAALPLVEQLVAQDRLPAVADLLARGRRFALETPATYFPAGTFPTLYTGLELTEHGLYYPFQWDAAAQRTRYAEWFPAPPSVWERVAAAGARALVVDPYESRPPSRFDGVFLSGWQFRNRVVLPARSRPNDAGRRLRRQFGRAPSVEEVFGVQSLATLRGMRRDLLAAPGRVGRVARHLLAREHFDLVWLTFSAAHLAGHQFWDLSQLPERDRAAARAEGLETTVADVYAEVDAAIAGVLEAVPDGATIVLFAGLGMGPDTSRVDLLPGMLDAVLSGGAPRVRTRAPGASLWRLRAAVPTRVRAAVAERLPRRAVLDLTARLETRASDWSKVRAFVLASDVVGYVRLNLRGREREGVVAPEEADELRAWIAAGLATFVDPDGAPAAAEVRAGAEVVPPGPRSDALPDLVVRWSDRPPAGLDRLVSPEFGEVPRPGSGSGRSGNHTADAWAVVAPASRAAERADARVVDLAATVCAALGVEHADLPGRSLL